MPKENVVNKIKEAFAKRQNKKEAKRKEPKYLKSNKQTTRKRFTFPK
jgi:hypothetical protein